MTTSSTSPAFDPATYEPLHPVHELDAATFSPLTAWPISEAAISACVSLLDGLCPKVTNKQRKAFGAIVADLLERDPDDQGGWLYRSKDPASFNEGAVGYRPFVKVYAAMIGPMIEELRGNRVWGSSEITANKKQAMWQRATRFRATPKMRQHLFDLGITRANWHEHFARDLSPPIASKATSSLVLRAGKPPRHLGNARGRRIPVDLRDPVVAAMKARMDHINYYLAKAEVSPHGPVILRRIFAHGDNPGHGWQQGGRLYAVGPSPYQTVKKALRSAITINGKPTCELDIQASHLTILAGLGLVPRFEGDPYVIEGLPRPVVKRWINMTLSHGKRHARWPSATVSDLLKDGFDVRADYPIEATGDTILRQLPILKNDGTSSVAVGWGELQFRESEVILAAMEVLAFKHDVPALPVHDSLIVPKDAGDVAKAVLGRAFRGAFGIDAEVE